MQILPSLPILKSGDKVEIIAPASRCSDQHLVDLKTLLTSWGFNCIVPADIFGKDLLCANTDEYRLQHLQHALKNPETKAIVCARGGYGSMRLIPKLGNITPIKKSKLFIGMSDLTALSLYINQNWQWPILHGALAVDKFSAESIAAFKSVLFGEMKQLVFAGYALNKAAHQPQLLDTTITGGNLTLVQAGIGTMWQMEAANKIIFLEEVGERGYRVDRMLEHLRQAKVLNQARAIILGDFLDGKEPDGSSLVTPVLQRFASSCDIPVIKINGVGHDRSNFPLPLGTRTELKLGKKIELICYT